MVSFLHCFIVRSGCVDSSVRLDMASALLSGSFDMHVHTAPDVHEDRAQNDLEFARSAVSAGMAGAVLKNHHSLTADRAALVRAVVPGLALFGSLCLDASVGGLTPYAVESALKFAPPERLCKVIWMPTIHAAAYARARLPREPGYSVLSESGHLRPEAIEIIELVRDADAVLATGHLPYTEAAPLVAEATRRGLERIVITHVDAPYLGIGPDERRELARRAFIEHCYAQTLPTNVAVTPAAVLASIRRCGAERCLIASDLGRRDTPTPVDGFRRYIADLLDAGATEAEIRVLAHDNPTTLLGLT
jgi:hypothetical protein